MYSIVDEQEPSNGMYLCNIDAAGIAAKRKAGQFVILRAHENGERIPLTLAGSDPGEGTISIVFQAAGRSTRAAHDYVMCENTKGAPVNRAGLSSCVPGKTDV